MVDKLESCPQCGREMTYRLGFLECAECGVEQPVPVEQPDPRKPGLSLPGATVAMSVTPARRADSIEMLTASRTPLADVSYVSNRPNLAPTLKIEKLILVCVFLIESVVQAMAMLSNAQIGIYVDVSATLRMLGGRIASTTLLLLALYLPVVPFKWICGGLACLMGTLGILSLFGFDFNLSWVNLGLPGIEGSFAGIPQWLLVLLDIGVNFWLASVMFRDLQQIDIARG